MGSVVFWFLFGIFADYSFPFGQALELMLACFTGTVSAKVNSFQQNLQKTEIISQPDNNQQVPKLNNLESQAWLYQGILERLGEDSDSSHEKIIRTLEALEYKRSELLQHLEPRRPWKYRVFAKIQDSARSLLSSQAQKDYVKLERLVTNLVLFASNRPSSQIILSEVIENVAVKIEENANQISIYRLRLAYKIDDLLKVISAKLVLNSTNFTTDQTYQDLVNSLRSQINLLSDQFNKILISRQQDDNALKSKINKFTIQISQINQQNLDLQQRIQSISNDAQMKESELKDLQDETYRLSRQKSEVEQQYRILSESYQQQKSEIANLKAQLSQVSRSPSSAKPVAIKREISEEEYKRISNQDDYVYVKAHFRNENLVRAYYRKRPNR